MPNRAICSLVSKKIATIVRSRGQDAYHEEGSNDPVNKYTEGNLSPHRAL